MTETQTADLPSESKVTSNRWGGGVSPYHMSWQKMMMWWFLITDALLFAAFLAAYGFNRLASDSWPVQTEVFHIELITFMTFVLISSSATMASAVAAGRRNDLRAARRFLWLTVLGGLMFLGCQAVEWTTFIRAGATTSGNPWGPAGFSAFFYTITGFHGTHVLIGVLVLLITTGRVKAGKSSGDGIELAGLYWHFVDLVWVLIFGFFYLI